MSYGANAPPQQPLRSADPGQESRHDQRRAERDPKHAQVATTCDEVHAHAHVPGSPLEIGRVECGLPRDTSFQIVRGQ